MKKAFLKFKKWVLKTFWLFIDWIEKYRPIEFTKPDWGKVYADDPPNPDPTPPIIPPK